MRVKVVDSKVPERETEYGIFAELDNVCLTLTDKHKPNIALAVHMSKSEAYEMAQHLLRAVGRMYGAKTDA
jgi:hypothetical protein